MGGRRVDSGAGVPRRAERFRAKTIQSDLSIGSIDCKNVASATPASCWGFFAPMGAVQLCVRYRRHRIELQVELRSSEGVPVRVSAPDACGNGCYLQIMATVCVGTQFTATFCIEDQRVRCECTVRTSDPISLRTTTTPWCPVAVHCETCAISPDGLGFERLACYPRRPRHLVRHNH